MIRAIGLGLAVFLVQIVSTVGAGAQESASALRARAQYADLILKNGKIVDVETGSFSESVAIESGRILFVGSNMAAESFAGPKTRTLELEGRTVIPGLNDSHSHLIRAGLNYNLELRWDGVRSVARALEMLKQQAARTPEGQWVRVVGGWNEFQFKERRLPTLEEINAAVPDKPVFILYLYSLGFLNKKAIEVLGYDSNTAYPGGELQKDESGNVTGLLVAKPSALILYKTLSLGPTLSEEEQLNSTRQFYRELNRLGVTSAIDAGGGGQSFPENYRVVEELAEQDLLTVRTAYYLFAQEKGKEKEFFERMVRSVRPASNSDMLKVNGYMACGGGENLTWAAADFENFLEPRPELPSHMERELSSIVDILVTKGWPFRIHATYDESIGRFLNVFQAVNRESPFFGKIRWVLDHAETISDRNLQKVKEFAGGIAIQNRMFFQGEHFEGRYGAAAARQTPPVRKMLELGIPVGLGTDGTRVSSYNMFLSLYWLTSGRTWGGLKHLSEENRLSRLEALRLATLGSAWFSGEENLKGNLRPGMFADLAVLSRDYFSIPEEQIPNLHSVLTIVDGKPVYGEGAFARLAPPAPEIIPDWSPVRKFGGYQYE